MINWMVEHWFIEGMIIIAVAMILAVIVRKFCDAIGE